MTPRLRLVAWRVQPILMVDDGENLTPIGVEPTDVPAARWDEFKAGGDDAAIEHLRAQITAPDQPPLAPASKA